MLGAIGYYLLFVSYRGSIDHKLSQNRRWGMGNGRQQTTNNQQQITNNQQPTTNDPIGIYTGFSPR
ncbi:MAG TPA: hypothetical protein DEG17_05515 [Cyanobacteria bacterium UBA11149]|nr:hypothetical protein [Cyanobacteria bacterium UBA11367]HBE57217.1 hypothetical protein [Cyanobacteria bacterium UBA11366]HBK64559.1 hypothetical protein [Cyanobacteria bacterium UBA11166]HBR73361.1 hypothetical protein [Cyanobacteria bacterium UBA11159]HBS72236.1 hypothetical protein [Cyanobacteria bacterium UBA11153]HBW88336.1 hypothetical protein [Cyanobacteria bacterium UBA11149]